jgi:hypothetical protein
MLLATILADEARLLAFRRTSAEVSERSKRNPAG